MEPIFNSRLLEYKKPFGAVKSGTQVSFCLRIPTEHGCETPYLFIRSEGGQAKQVALEKQGRENDRDIFTCSYTPEEAGIYFYWFDLWKDYKKIYKSYGGVGIISTDEGLLYQLTVYSPSYKTPEEVRGGVMYQIFPDRFLEGNPGKSAVYNERIYREDKTQEPYYIATNIEGGKLTLDYFGGDFAGIEKKLPFLYSLGVNWIYLNPIFEAHSNHRYNTADYMNADPYLGTNEDFERLCQKAKAFGIHIILDGVFSHTGSDSIYFNREARYPSFGAWQGLTSPYRKWYSFHPNGSYDSWWGFETLPTCNKYNHDFRRFICGKDGVIDTWLKRGASGFRLDVADELPDDFIVEIRRAVKRHGSDKLLIGEVWEDASNKESYGVKRKYLLGDELDGVMNYPFLNAILDYLKNFDSLAFNDSIMTIVENYPEPAMAATTNHLSTHDSIRFITAVAGESSEGKNREWQSLRRLTSEQYYLGLTRLKLAFVLQFTLPGIPCVYYGDEIAMQGYKDPFNRAYYDWHSHETAIIPVMMELGRLRKNCPAFRENNIKFLKCENGIVSFERRGGGETAAVCINCSPQPVKIEMLGEDVNIPVMGFAVRTSNKIANIDIITGKNSTGSYF